MYEQSFEKAVELLKEMPPIPLDELLEKDEGILDDEAEATEQALFVLFCQVVFSVSPLLTPLLAAGRSPDSQERERESFSRFGRAGSRKLLWRLAETGRGDRGGGGFGASVLETRGNTRTTSLSLF